MRLLRDDLIIVDEMLFLAYFSMYAHTRASILLENNGIGN